MDTHFRENSIHFGLYRYKASKFRVRFMNSVKNCLRFFGGLRETAEIGQNPLPSTMPLCHCSPCLQYPKGADLGISTVVPGTGSIKSGTPVRHYYWYLLAPVPG